MQCSKILKPGLKLTVGTYRSLKFYKCIIFTRKLFWVNPILHGHGPFHLLVLLDWILSAEFLSILSKLFGGENLGQSG